jgi:hypothetical protein
MTARHTFAIGRRLRAAAAAVLVLGAGLLLISAPAEAAVTAVKGSACAYYVNVGLFGGPQDLRGCGQPANAPANAASPSVSLPAGGSATAITQTDDNGAIANYGPATIFGGRWPCDPDNCVLSPPPSGPLAASTQGTPASGTVKSTADITLYPTPTPVRCFNQPAGTTNCRAPGGFGPSPVEGDSLHVECNASATAITGSTTFKNGVLAKATDADGNPTNTEAIPDNPPVNYTRSGVITNVGDVFTVVFNQQIPNADGSLTVNAVHVYLFGPTAVGDMVKGQATCGVTPSPLPTDDRVAPSCGLRDIEPVSPEDPSPKVPQVELIGVFDAGGLQSITNIQAKNATVSTGVPGGFPYLVFQPGQTGPLQMTATQIDTTKPMSWSFDAVDKAGNVTHSSQCPTDSAQVTPTSSTSSIVPPPTSPATTSPPTTSGSNTTTTASGGTGGGGGSGNTGGTGTSGSSTGDPSSSAGGAIQGSALARTGGWFEQQSKMGLALMLAGATLLLCARRRQH